ncbi:hypothetical protein GC098_18995 [Paenibacillus sp. LMG 31458]|uniref:Uncharacterized protein n=1 Tax=Paenibacillus phytorum TaxID=2654977 RepID=A0ABX1XY35_9BACL|nr:hypothetical protein [Paenibacillus phytorum]NOU73482.1 hypothetical protein [Paenibacillus phytorum]
MKKEYIIHFKVIHKDSIQLLRGLIFLDENQKPTIYDFQQCLIDCGHEVRIENTEQAIFKAYKPGEQYWIQILRDQENNTRDLNVENLAKNFMKNEPTA